MPCLKRQAFDESAFQTPYYRVDSAELASLKEEIAALRQSSGRVIVDAKSPAEDLAAHRLLQTLGFAKVCMQIELRQPLTTAKPLDPEAAVADTVSWPAEVIDAHAKNFIFDRFSLDLRLPRAGHDRLYRAWIGNSLASPGIQVLSIGHNFVTFRTGDDGVRIDLLSVLEKGAGNGRRLLDSLCSWAQTAGQEHVTTITECENKAAVQLYLKCGFVPNDFQAVWHLVQDQ